MVAHVWSPDTTAENTYGYGLTASDGTDTTVTTTFTDVDSSKWYYTAVNYVVNAGIMQGVGNNKFDVTGTVTRGTVMTVLARRAGEDTTGSDPWYQAGVNWAVKENVSDGTNATGSVTREQLVTMLWRYVDEPESNGSLAAFSDAGKVSSWAKDAMAWAVENGLIQGYGNGTVNPTGTATRAEFAKIMMAFCQLG
jgi:hypothetical protein